MTLAVAFPLLKTPPNWIRFSLSDNASEEVRLGHTASLPVPKVDLHKGKLTPGASFENPQGV